MVSVIFRSSRLFGLQLPQRGLRGGLLGIFLGRTFRARNRLAPHAHLDQKYLAMLRAPLLDHDVTRLGPLVGLQVFLQRRLVVVEGKGVDAFLQPVAQDELVDEPPCRLDSTVQVQSRDQSLQCIDQYRTLGAPAAAFLTAAQLQVAAQIQLPGNRQQEGGAHQMCLELGELSLGVRGEALQQPRAHQEPKNRVAKKLQLLVVGRSNAPFVGQRAMGQSLAQQFPLPEGIAQRRFKLAVVEQFTFLFLGCGRRRGLAVVQILLQDTALFQT